MPARRIPMLKTTLAEVARAQELLDKERYDDAREILERAHAFLTDEGQRSSHVLWLLAVTCDFLDDLPQALHYAEQAVDLDPASPALRRSYEIVVERLRTAVGEARPGDEETPKLYELLIRADEADAGSHLAMARWHAESGNPAEAWRVLEALTVLAPSHREAWSLKATVARTLGKVQEAREAELEASGRGDPASLGFPISGGIARA
ncbi:MAG: tetratricopeptide repeat protein [Myxococcales bacterium]